jgi:S1-C subfamily serine protease
VSEIEPVEVRRAAPRVRRRDSGHAGLVHLAVIAAVLVGVLAGFAVAVPYATRVATLVRETVTAFLKAGAREESAPPHGSTSGSPHIRAPRHAPSRPGGSAGSRSTGPGTATSSTTSTNPITAAVRADVQGIVRIVGVAPACSLEQEGSGFVVSLDHVLTNAHVVHGLHAPRVQIGGAGYRYAAHVVFYDPSIDLAVLDVPGLPARPLPISTVTLPTRTAAVAAGFPLNGPFTLSTGHVQGHGLDVGPPVGTARPRQRPVYQLSVLVRPGNSGGPLLTADGRVAGVVFARGSTRTPTGFAITSEAALAAARSALAATRPVSTGSCR